MPFKTETFLKAGLRLIRKSNKNYGPSHRKNFYPLFFFTPAPHNHVAYFWYILPSLVGARIYEPQAKNPSCRTLVTADVQATLGKVFVLYEG